MNNLLIETSAIKTFPKELEPQTFFRATSVHRRASPSSNARNLKRRSLKMFVLRVIWQVHTVARRESPIPFYSQSGALDPTDIKSIQCVVGRVEDRGKWEVRLTAVARWHMRYSLRQISWRQHDRASEFCVLEPICSALHCLAAVVYSALFSAVVCHRRTH